MNETLLAKLSAAAYGWPESLEFTYGTARRLIADGVQGCFVECGVAAGVHPAAMAAACVDAGSERMIHLFDSFEGIPHGGPRDTDWNQAWGDGSGRLESSGVTVHSLDEVQENLLGWVPEAYDRQFALYKGWFQDTVPQAAPHIGEIAFLRLDGDLYDSTLVCLQHLWPLMAENGVLVVDDLNLDGCRAAVCDYFVSTHGSAPPFKQITEAGDGFVIASTVGRLT